MTLNLMLQNKRNNIFTFIYKIAHIFWQASVSYFLGLVIHRRYAKPPFLDRYAECVRTASKLLGSYSARHVRVQARVCEAIRQ